MPLSMSEFLNTKVPLGQPVKIRSMSGWEAGNQFVRVAAADVVDVGPGPLTTEEHTYPRHQSAMYLKPVLDTSLRELAQGAQRQGLGEIMLGDDLDMVRIISGLGARWGQGLCPEPTQVLPGNASRLDDLARQMGFAGAKIAINTATGEVLAYQDKPGVVPPPSPMPCDAVSGMAMDERKVSDDHYHTQQDLIVMPMAMNDREWCNPRVDHPSVQDKAQLHIHRHRWDDGRTRLDVEVGPGDLSTSTNGTGLVLTSTSRGPSMFRVEPVPGYACRRQPGDTTYQVVAKVDIPGLRPGDWSFGGNVRSLSFTQGGDGKVNIDVRYTHGASRSYRVDNGVPTSQPRC